MSLKIKCVQYYTVNVHTFHDFNVLFEEMKYLLVNGYSLTLDVCAIAQDPWGEAKFPPIPRKKHNFTDNATVNARIESEDSGQSTTSLHPPKYYFQEDDSLTSYNMCNSAGTNKVESNMV